MGPDRVGVGRKNEVLTPARELMRANRAFDRLHLANEQKKLTDSLSSPMRLLLSSCPQKIITQERLLERTEQQKNEELLLG